MLIVSYENEISLTCKLNSFSYERMSTKTGFEEEVKGNSEIAYILDTLFMPVHTSSLEFENGGFTLKGHQMFSVHTTPEQFENVKITQSFWICV